MSRDGAPGSPVRDGAQHSPVGPGRQYSIRLDIGSLLSASEHVFIDVSS
jgi:hypothetical protein